MSGRASIGILVTDLEAMLVDVISVQIMEMPIMQVVNVILMLDRGVTTTGAVSVIVTFVNFAYRHLILLMIGLAKMAIRQSDILERPGRLQVLFEPTLYWS